MYRNCVIFLMRISCNRAEGALHRCQVVNYVWISGVHLVCLSVRFVRLFEALEKVRAIEESF